MEIVQAQQIMLAALSGALAVLLGALHALFLALAKLGESRRHLWISYAAYALFAVATLVLAHTLHLSGHWFLIIVLMLCGYLLAPYGIWHLSVATHGLKDEAGAARPRQSAVRAVEEKDD